MSFTKTQNKFSKGIDDKAGDTAVTISSSTKVGVGTDDPKGILSVANANGGVLEFLPSSDNNFIRSYDRTASSYVPYAVQALTHSFNMGNNNSALFINDAGVATFSGDLISDANVFGANFSTVGAVAAARADVGAPNIALPTHKGQVRVGTYSVDGNLESGIEWQVRGDGAGYGFRAVNTNSGASGNEWILQTRGNSASWTNTLVVGGDGTVSADKLIIDNPNGAGNFKAGIHIVSANPLYDDQAGMIRIDGNSANNPALIVGVGESAHTNFAHYANGTHTFGRPTGTTLTLDTNGNATFSGSVTANDGTFSDTFVAGKNAGTTTIDNRSIYSPYVGIRLGGGQFPDNILPCDDGGSSTTGDVNLGHLNYKFKDGHFSGTVYANGSPLTSTRDLVTTLSTLHRATMDETKDIRESLRSAIEELIEGFEQQIAAMPAPEAGE